VTQRLSDGVTQERSARVRAIRNFRDLAAWQRGMELAERLYSETSELPDSERFGLVSQLRRAAVSVPSNIAEGYGRGTTAEFLRFLRVARGSVFEIQTQIELARRLGLTNPHASVVDLIAETDRVLQGLIRSLEDKEREVS